MSDIYLSDHDRIALDELKAYLHRSANVASQAAALAGMIEVNNIRRYQGKAIAYAEDAIEDQIREVINA